MDHAMLDLRREKDIERLREVALLQASQLEHLVTILSRKCAELEKLKGSEGELQQTLKLLEQVQAHKQSSKLTSEGPVADEPKPRVPQRGHGPTDQPALERVLLHCELDEADRKCPACGGGLEPLANQCEHSELIDIVDIKYQLVAVERQKYVCKCGSAVETAPGPERTIEGGRYSLRFGVKVAFDKYVNHLPLERQVRSMAYYGLEVTSQTLWDQCWAVTQLLIPTYEAIYDQVVSRPVIGLDQTSWPDLEDKEMPPWQMWCLTAPGLVYHRICDDKSAATFKSLVGPYKGVIVCDAAATHGAGARDDPGITLAGCWAHIYRRFRDAEKDFPEVCFVLAWIQDLYRIDARATSLDERNRLRRTESTVALDKMKTWMTAQRVLATTTLGSAIRHTLKNWERLTVFVQNPFVWLDNNQTERGLRGPVIGRRNHFGSKSARGTEVAAVMYSLVESAKVSGIDPIAYLVEVATRAQRAPGTVVLPDAFKLRS
jgi:transposase